MENKKLKPSKLGNNRKQVYVDMPPNFSGSRTSLTELRVSQKDRGSNKIGFTLIL